MGRSPFAPKPRSQESRPNRRRSTRVEWVTPVILSGRDATGQPFREETETSIVNLHGCRLRTRHEVLVGMHVGIENPSNGMSGNAVCVRILDEPPGGAAREIAIQLVAAKNMWGVENPPPDWGAIEGAARLGLPITPAPVSTVAATPEAPLQPQLAQAEQCVAKMVEAAVQDLRARLDDILRVTLQNFQERLEGMAAETEQRVAGAVDPALQDYRSRLDDVTRSAFASVQPRLDTIAAEAEACVTRQSNEALAELDSKVGAFRSVLKDELTARREQAVLDAEKALRSRMAEMASAILRSVSDSRNPTTEQASAEK
jgi:hypothetical protein